MSMIGICVVHMKIYLLINYYVSEHYLLNKFMFVHAILFFHYTCMLLFYLLIIQFVYA